MYYFLGASLLFALLLILNIFVSLAATVWWRVFEKRTQHWSAQTRTQIIFALRVFPLFFTVIFFFALVIPAYLLFEPESQDEKVTYKLAIPALISLGGMIVTFYRVFGTWWQTRKLIKSWLKCSEPILIENVSLPVYRLRHQFPVIAVVGVFQPKLFIAEQIFSLLNEEELAAAILHETGHLATHDNFKRVLLRVCRDLLVFPMGKKLEQKWAESSESAADEYAAQIKDKTALNLASALVKIAKTVPPTALPTMPLGSFLIEKSRADITSRVRRLLQLAENLNLLKPISTFNLRLAFQICFAVIFIAVLVLATNHSFLFEVHMMVERVVAVLQ